MTFHLEEMFLGLQTHNTHDKTPTTRDFFKRRICPRVIYMKTLSKAGWFTLGLGIILLAGVFWHYNGLNDIAYAMGRMIAAMGYGGILWFGLFCVLMAFLFLNG